MKKTVFLSLLFVFVVTSIHLYAQGTEQDRKAIEGIIAKINYAYTVPNGADVISEVMSASSLSFLTTGPSSTSVLDKKSFLNLFAQMMKNNPPLRHVHTLKTLSIRGTIAYEIATIEHTGRDGSTQAIDNFMVYIKEDSGWKLLIGIPLSDMATVLPALTQ